MAGVLGSLGCDLPDSESGGGSLQSGRIGAFNDELLASAGSARDDFAPFYREWLQSPRAPEFLDRAQTLLEQELGNAQLFVLSDPNICRILPFWTEALERFGCTLKPILLIRNPVEVARSLRSEKGLSEPLSQMIWLRHMLDAERETRGMPRFHTSFEQLIGGWESVAQKAEESLKLVWPKSIANAEFEVARLLSDGQRDDNETSSATMSSTLLPEWLRETYDILNGWAKNGETRGDETRLDRIRAEFDVASNAFARVIRATQRSGTQRRLSTAGGADLPADSNDLETLRAMLQEQRRKATLLNADLQQQIEAREAIESQLLDAQAEIAASRARRKEMARVITNRETKIARLNEQLNARYAELAALERHIMRSNPLSRVAGLFRRIGRATRRVAQKA